LTFYFFDLLLFLLSGETVFLPLLKHLNSELFYTPEVQLQVKEIKRLMEDGYATSFDQCYGGMRSAKLGLSSFQGTDPSGDEELWNFLLSLLHR
jgi:hypothetical protein